MIRRLLGCGVGGLIVLVSATCCRTALASGGLSVTMPHHDWSVGPGLAYVHQDSGGAAPTLDVAFTEGVLAGSLNVGYFRIGRVDALVTRAEFSGWFIANWGLGAGYWLAEERGPLVHLFAGFPFPGVPLDDEHMFFEPYYRANFVFLDSTRIVHELGLMIKYTTYKI